MHLELQIAKFVPIELLRGVWSDFERTVGFGPDHGVCGVFIQTVPDLVIAGRQETPGVRLMPGTGFKGVMGDVGDGARRAVDSQVHMIPRVSIMTCGKECGRCTKWVDTLKQARSSSTELLGQQALDVLSLYTHVEETVK